MELDEAIARANTALMAHPQHHLLPPYRWEIYASLAHETRAGEASLALLAGRHVLPLWRRARPGDALPARLLALAAGHLAGAVPAPMAQRAADKAWDRLERLGRDFARAPSGFYAGEAAYRALTAALGRPPFGDVTVTAQDTEDDLDPYCADTAHWAARACASSASDAHDEAVRRCTFWRWWLNVAVPASCQHPPG